VHPPQQYWLKRNAELKADELNQLHDRTPEVVWTVRRATS
jgi:hypothetical protein